MVAAVSVMLSMGLMAGCHKKAQVSRRGYPAPPASRRGHTDTRRGHTETNRGTSRRSPPDVVIPGSPAPEDNRVPSGKVSSVEVGVASWYAPSGRRSANGDVYDGNSMTAAHRTLPLGTLVRVTNLSTNQAVTVTITDRGPFVRGRVLDLSTAAARASGVYRMGVAQVRIEVLQQRPDVSPVGRWCVQVGAFTEEGNAQRLKLEMLRRYSTSAKVIEFPGATGHWVRINPVASDRAHAAAIAQTVQVAEADAQAYLVRLD